MNERSLDEVSWWNVGNIPESHSSVLDDVHVVGASSIVFYIKKIKHLNLGKLLSILMKKSFCPPLLCESEPVSDHPLTWCKYGPKS